MALSDIISELRGCIMRPIRRNLFKHDGSLRSTRHLPTRLKASLCNSFAVQDRAEIALAVAGMYPGGDYLEFGSESFTTFRNFLSAFDLNGLGAKCPETMFYSFDIFGDAAGIEKLPERDHWYFKQYTSGRHDYAGAEHRLKRHGLFLDRCKFVKGYFHDTLSDEFSESYNSEGRSVGFAFIDCNIGSSYKPVFEFLRRVSLKPRAFVYMDEYFLDLDVPGLFADFCASLPGRKPLYLRNAGSFGALYCLI